MRALGAAIRDAFQIDPGACTVNHGSYGATPLVVLAEQDRWRRVMEAQTSRFFNRILPGALREAAGRLAAHVGADPEDLAFVPNATTGVNAVLRSIDIRPSEEILLLGHAYGAVRNTARYVAERAGARLVEAPLPWPRPSDAAIVASVGAALSPRTRIAVLDHITSPSAVAVPVADLVALCHERGVRVLVDGAHAPGQVPLDVGAIGADWYTGNAHKWLFAPKGCAFLHARRDVQAGLHPTTISHGLGRGFTAEFDWTGTIDPSAYLAIGAALDFHAALGGPALMARNAAQAAAASARLASMLGTETGHGNGGCGAMATLRVPGPGTTAAAQALRGRLMDAGCDAPVHALQGGLWLRVSAQAYNEPGDYERLGAILTSLL
ncbi:MAG: aminotransferase class V-fold PLP-dependent enzyme [Rhodospirillales bacterium]|nr:aminotransferase class V-fold PLP-dependent enzyme [Rhodospirillales bacterium]